MSFDEPRTLLLLLAAAPLAFWSASRSRRRLGAFLDLSGRRDGGNLERELSFRFSLAGLFFLAAVVSAVLSLAGPRWGERLVPEFRRGLDVVLAMDVSRSMDAGDVAPSRLSAAAAVARRFVEAEGGLRFAVALGKGDGVLAVPLTDDDESVVSLLRTLNSGSLSSGGTDLERLLDASRSAFPQGSTARKLVVLFSDGESLSGAVADAAGRASDEGVKVACVAVGTESGATLPLTDAAGSPVRSTLRPEALRAVSERTGSIFVDGTRPDAARILSSYAAGLSAASASDGVRRESVPRYRLFAFLAAAFFLASKFAETVARGKR